MLYHYRYKITILIKTVITLSLLCPLPITFANSLESKPVLIKIQTGIHSDNFPKRIFLKKVILNKTNSSNLYHPTKGYFRDTSHLSRPLGHLGYHLIITKAYQVCFIAKGLGSV